MVEGVIDVPRVPNFVTFTSSFAWLIFLFFTTGAVTDVVIAASLCYYLKRMTLGEKLKTWDMAYFNAIPSECYF